MEDRERGLREHDLGLLLRWGVEDREQEERPRQLGDICLLRGDVQRPLDDRRAGEEGERRLGDRDMSLAGLLFMPGSDDWREREGCVLDQWRGAGEWLQRLAVDCGEAGWRLGPGLRQWSSWEHEQRPGLWLTALRHLDGGDSLSGDEEGLESCLRKRPSLLDRDLSPEGLQDMELPSARFDMVLSWAHDASRSPDRSVLEPIFRVGIEGPTVSWGGAAPTYSSPYPAWTRKKVLPILHQGLNIRQGLRRRCYGLGGCDIHLGRCRVRNRRWGRWHRGFWYLVSRR